MRKTILISCLLCAFFTLTACDYLNSKHNGHTSNNAQSKNNEETKTKSAESDRPSNQTAVLTVWAPADKVDSTIKFYKDTLGLRPVAPNVLDTDGTFLVVMEGDFKHPTNTKARWPLFALSVPDLNSSIKTLSDAGVELPWGIEEFGKPEPSSRYVMFYDPAGNLIEIVEWL